MTSRTVLIVLVVIVGLMAERPKPVTASYNKQALAAHQTNRQRDELPELRAELDRLAGEILDHMATYPDDFAGREELWMRREELRGLHNALRSWSQA